MSNSDQGSSPAPRTYRAAASPDQLLAGDMNWTYVCNDKWSFPIRLTDNLPEGTQYVDKVIVRLPLSNTTRMPEITSATASTISPSGDKMYHVVKATSANDGTYQNLTFSFGEPIPVSHLSGNKVIQIDFTSLISWPGAWICSNRQWYAQNGIMPGATVWLNGTSHGNGSQDGLVGTTATIRVKTASMPSEFGVQPISGATLQLFRDDNSSIEYDPYWGNEGSLGQWGNPGTKIDADWARCTVEQNGYCTFEVPAPTSGQGSHYWVGPATAPDGYNVIDELRSGFSGGNMASFLGARGSSHAFKYAYYTPALSAGQTIKSGDGNSGDGFMTFTWENQYTKWSSEGVYDPRSSSGQIVFRKDNPALPDQCGLNVAVILDTSGSMGSPLFQGGKSTRESAIAGISRLAEGLRGTGSKLALKTFASDLASGGLFSRNSWYQIEDPIEMNDAGVQKVKDNLKKLSFEGATNWDAALRSAASHNESSNASNRYDVVLMVTDGNPTRSAKRGQAGPGNAGDFAMVENAILSANRLKASGQGTRIVGVGVGSFSQGGIVGRASDPTLSQRNLTAISGPNGTTTPVVSASEIAKKDWIVFDGTNEDNLARVLSDIALAGCHAAITVEKETQVDDGEVRPGGAGWHFDASGLARGFTFADATTASSLAKNTGDDSTLEYRLQLARPTLKNGTITISENILKGPEPSGGWDIVKRGTQNANAICVDTTHPSKPEVLVENIDKYGFKLSDLSNASRIHCKVLNKKVTAKPHFKVEKAVQGFPAGKTGKAIQIGPDGRATVTYEVKVTNSGTVAAKHPKIEDSLTVPAGFTVEKVSLDGRQINGQHFEIPEGSTELQPILKGSPAGQDNYATYKVEVVVKAVDLNRVDWTKAGICKTDGAGEPSAGGLFNLVTMRNDADGPENNDACVPVTPPAKTYLKLIKVDASNKSSELNGAEFSLFPSDAAGLINRSAPVTFENGRFEIRDGYYAIVETKAPTGFNLLPGPVFIEVVTQADGKHVFLNEPDKQKHTLKRVNGASTALVDLLDPTTGEVTRSSGTTPDRDGTVKIRIADVTTGTLPVTGDSGILPVMMLSILAAAAAISIAQRRSMA
ncbi:SpaA isopeptide-forming pilin-related protein [Arcanobacterium canis]